MPFWLQRPFGRIPGRLASITMLAVLLVPAFVFGARDEGRDLGMAVRRALESGDAASLRQLFPTEQKVHVSLGHIADLQGFVGAGPLVEAFRRYVTSRTDVRFELEDGGRADRVRGRLCTRDRTGKRDKVGLIFVFERTGGELRAVEVRETG